MSFFNRLILQCRSGFEKEVAAEITDQCAVHGIYGYCTLNQGDGYLSFHFSNEEEAKRAIIEVNFSSLIFVRQWCLTGDSLQLDAQDRISPIVDLLNDFPTCCDVWVEYPDTTDGREMGTFSRKFGSALAQSLRKKGILQNAKPEEAVRLLLFALSGNEIFVGYAPVRNSAASILGISRLKFPKDAPSRSTLKLEEAWHWFIPKKEWDERIPFGSTAVDLGAAPGGWTWQLVNRSMFVTAVDNGPMQPALMESGQVKHVQEDAYRFIPADGVTLMVCDVVDKPSKTATLAADWVIHGWSEQAIFNLKLPMKQRYQEVVACLNLIAERFMQEGMAYELQARHLYHDREEITCYLRRL